MKKGIHPEYRPVVFYDVGADFKLLTYSTAQTNETTTLEGKEYPMVKLEISSASHPFFTGQQKFVDTQGRVERFQRKFGGEYFKKPEKKKTGRA
jgi:large subunit ribosomal protein L31